MTSAIRPALFGWRTLRLASPVNNEAVGDAPFVGLQSLRSLQAFLADFALEQLRRLNRLWLWLCRHEHRKTARTPEPSLERQ